MLPFVELALFKTFIFGVIIGIGAAGALLYFVPAVDQGRERSIISVQANGGNREAFHVNLPTDRIFSGRSGAGEAFPAGANWPESLEVTNAQAELFKVRNEAEQVVGVASRISADDDQPFVEWVLHMPARGTLYLILESSPTAAGNRTGSLHAGSREFADLRGSVVERYQAEPGGEGEYSTGRLELVTVLVGPDAPPTSFAEDEPATEGGG